MKARQLKKLSKKIALILSDEYKESWVDKEVMESAWSQGTKVSGELRVGGELDYWGEGTDDYPVFIDFVMNLDTWLYPYPTYPEGSEFEGMPMRHKMRHPMTGKMAVEHAKVIATNDQTN